MVSLTCFLIIQVEVRQVCLPFSSFCAECISQDAEQVMLTRDGDGARGHAKWQALYHRCPETGKSTIRQVTWSLLATVLMRAVKVSSSQLARFDISVSSLLPQLVPLFLQISAGKIPTAGQQLDDVCCCDGEKGEGGEGRGDVTC